MAKKKKATVRDSKKVGNYVFEHDGTGYAVTLKKRGKAAVNLGMIFPDREPTGRHCFYLGQDTRTKRKRRTYRGKLRAATALESIHNAERQLAKGVDPALVVIQSWDDRPKSSDQW